VKQPRSWPRLLQIHHRDNFARIEPAEERRGAADPDVHAVRWIPDDVEQRRKVPEFNGHAQVALDDVLAGDGQPQEARAHQRDDLEPEVSKGVISHQAS
jgi:iron uptake system EfeUOB component EfeO/EfeM